MTPSAANPFMPAEGTAVLENLAFDLAREASDPHRRDLQLEARATSKWLRRAKQRLAQLMNLPESGFRA